MLLADGLQNRLARVGRQRFIQTLLHVGGFGVGIDALGRAGGDAHQRRVGDVSRFPAGCLHAPDATDEQKRQHRGQAKHTLGAAGFCGIVPAIRMVHQRQHTADGGPCQVHKSRGQSKQRRPQDHGVGRQPRQITQPEQLGVAGPAAAAPERPRPGQHHHRHKLALVQAAVLNGTQQALHRGKGCPQVEQPPHRNRLPFNKVERHADGGGGQQRPEQRPCYGQCLPGQQGHALGGGEIVLRVVQNQRQAAEQQRDAELHAGERIHQKRHTADGAAAQQHPGAAVFRLAIALAQNQHADPQHSKGRRALGEGQIPEAGAHRAQRHQPQLLAAAGDIVVQAEERRQRPVELLAGVVRAKEPLGHEGEQHQRRQQRGGLAQVAAELPVKDVAHARLAGQHHEPEEHQHAGSAARDADEHRQQCGGGQAG